MIAKFAIVGHFVKDGNRVLVPFSNEQMPLNRDAI
jgi:hypothetical protein